MTLLMAQFGFGSTAQQTILDFGMISGGNKYVSGLAVFNTNTKYTYGTESLSTMTNLATQRGYHATTSSMYNMYSSGGGSTTSNATDLSSTEKLTYATNSIAFTASLSSIKSLLVALCYKEYAYFCGGFKSSGSVVYNSVEKLNLAADTMSSGTNVINGLKNQNSNLGNGTFGMTVGHSSSTIIPGYTNKYTYSNDTVASGTSFVNTLCLTACYGTKDVGYTNGGMINAVQSSACYKYTYATNVISSVSSLSYNIADNCGNSGTAFGVAHAGNYACDKRDRKSVV